jgi:competence ComEA-like helix-hairpin-helix protein
MTSETPSDSKECFDLNLADKEQLCDVLPGIGPVLADRIVAFRESHGAFADLMDLGRVPGIGPRLAGRILEHMRARELAAVANVSAMPDASLGVGCAAPFEPGCADVEGAQPVEPVSTDVEGTKPVGSRSADIAHAPPAEACTVAVHSAPPVDPLSSRPRNEPDDDGGVVLSAVAGRDRGHGQPRTFAIAALLVFLVGASASSWHSERTARATSATIDHEVRALQVEEARNHDELVRQAGLLAVAQADLASSREALKEADARAEQRSSRIAADVGALGDRMRQAQARTDARVYRLDEAMKLVDWATTSGLARKAAADATD